MAEKFYAVKVGRKPGVYLNWNDCKAQVDGYTGAKYKSFKTYEEAIDFSGVDENYKQLSLFDEVKATLHVLRKNLFLIHKMQLHMLMEVITFQINFFHTVW